jgi:hypothetical protein
MRLRFDGVIEFVNKLLYSPRCLLRSVNHSDYVYLVGLDVIDDSVRALQNFPYLRELDFRDDAARLGKGADLPGMPGETVNDS